MELNPFAPVRWVEIGDWVVGGMLALLRLTNARRMVRFVERGTDGARMSLLRILREAGTFFMHFAVQKQWRECTGSRTPRRTHLLLMTGYLTMIVLVVVFLRWFQTDEIVPIYHPVRLFGYYATAVLLYGSAIFLAGRLKRRVPMHNHSEASDWIFLVLMLLTTLTGMLVHVFRLVRKHRQQRAEVPVRTAA